MNNFMMDQLDESISALFAGGTPPTSPDVELCELLQVADELRYVPRPAFRATLRADLLASMQPRAACPEQVEEASPLGAPKLRTRGPERNTVIPPLFSSGTGSFPIRGSHLAVSFGLHVVALALIAASGWWVVQNRTAVRTRVAELVPGAGDYLLPIAPGKIGGGGGGGEHDKLNASHGTPPPFASEQLTPPTAIVRNEDPKLPAQPTVIGPPNVFLPQSAQTGDPMSAILAPLSNGTGSGGAIGTGHGGGAGSGEGPGVGEGSGGGIGGGIYHVGGGVSAPRPIYDPDPEYSEEARKAKYQGTVLLLAIIGPDGHPRDLRVTRSLGMGLDQKALDAVWKWRFSPAMKDGRPVSVAVSIEVAFRLY